MTTSVGAKMRCEKYGKRPARYYPARPTTRGICQGLLSVLVPSLGGGLNMLREYANDISFDARGFIEEVGGYALDSVTMGHKLRLPRDA